MNRNTLVGVVAGLGIAVAGGVAGFSMMGTSPGGEEQIAGELETGSAEIAGAPAPASAPAAAAAPAAAPAPPPAQRTAAAPAQPRTVERCWEEEIEVPAEPRDDKAIAGTAAGAVVGGALADRLGDDNDLVTAAGAAAGAFLGRKAQREFQENRTATETVTRCEQVAAE
ncbi:MAG TPA: glycine zipper 2TM domain-containing protein [Gammaproteobacteria bacterium]|nr:glycine zipper 2TM domain-containing protein [Gammaproteobacteria bacterium]